MNWEIVKNEAGERTLYLSNGRIRLGLALDFGIRIVWLSCEGMQNLYYEQPADGSDGFTTPEGWRLRGGHRLWAAPENDLTYWPDNDPVDYEICGNSVTLTQKPEDWLKIRKSLKITLQEDGTVLLEHAIENVGTEPAVLASWGVNTLAGGGKAEAFYGGGTSGALQPERFFSLWSDTSLADPRLQFTKEKVLASHMPIDDYFKLGLFSTEGRAILHSRGQRLEITFNAVPGETYPDGGCNFELFLCRQFMELETLGVSRSVAPGESACHWERWNLTPEAKEV